MKFEESVPLWLSSVDCVGFMRGLKPRLPLDRIFPQPVTTCIADNIFRFRMKLAFPRTYLGWFPAFISSLPFGENSRASDR